MLAFIGKVLLMAWLVFEVVSLFIVVKTAFKAGRAWKAKRGRENVNVSPIKGYIGGVK